MREIALPEQRNKKKYILSTTMHSDQHLLSKQSFSHNPELAEDYLRAAQWNIERGFKIEIIDLLLNDFSQYQTKYMQEDLSEEELEKITEQAKVLQNTDIFMLNEVDIGMPRTEYQNIADKFAQMINGDFAFITEFLEVDPSIIEKPDLQHDLYKGLHGNAIISRFPIKSTRIIRLPQCYDWFSRERENINLVENIRRQSSKLALDEKILTEIRRGSRVALVAEIELPNSEIITAVSVHLENRCQPQCREKQMQVLLAALQDVRTPLVLGGDLNNFEKSAEPTSMTQIIKNRITDPNLIGKTVISVFNPFALITNTASMGISFLRKHKDPLVFGIPIFLPNKVKKLFSMIEDFQFADEQQFDFSGDDKYSIAGRDDELSNSNQRGFKGFIETFRFKRNYSVALYKIDWLFVKPSNEKYYPAFGRTLKELNYSLKQESISDHTPITVDIRVAPR